MKYLFLTDGAAFWPSLTADYHGAGAFNWPKAMQGDTRLWAELSKSPEQLLQYDLIHINLAGEDVGLAAKIKPFIKDTSTKLVVNCDYSINYMDKNVNLFSFLSDIKATDYAFGVEPGQVNLLTYLGSIMGTGHRTMLLPHPVDLQYMKDQWIDNAGRKDALAFHYHKYDGHIDIPWMITDGIPLKEKLMLGYTNAELDIKNFPGWTVQPFVPWETYLYALKYCKYGLEYRTHKAASRFIMECASLGIPCVSTHDSFMGVMLFPELSHPTTDFSALHHSIRGLLDEDYRLEVAAKGLEKIQNYDFESSKKNMLRLVEDV
jgi:hypothetical protein